MCIDIPLAVENYVQVEHDDVIGIYIPESVFSSVAVVGEFNNPLPPGVGIHRDSRNSILVMLARGSVGRSDLDRLRTAGLHLYADIGTSK